MAAAKVNAVTGTTAATLDAAYLTSPLTTTQIGSTDFTLGMINDALVATVGRIIRTYANVPNHPFRNFNLSQTSNIANKAALPSVNSASKPIVGVYGVFRDAVTGTALTLQPVQVVRTITDNTDTFLKKSYFHYCLTGDRIEHTVANAVADVVTFSASDELTAIAANGNAPIPDACLDVAVMGLIASLFIDGEFLDQTAAAGQYFERALADMPQGKTTFAPAPNFTASADPVAS